jgi:hypothetical protein
MTPETSEATTWFALDWPARIAAVRKEVIGVEGPRGGGIHRMTIERRTRMNWRRILIGLMVVSSPTLMAQSPDAPTIPNLPDVNPELLTIVVADQWDRGMDMFSGRQVKPPDSLKGEDIEKRDTQRRRAVRAMLNAGRIQTGREYQFASILFQHSVNANDLQTAHLLASTAVLKGNQLARWLAAATFDRLLWNLNQPQVFGTQFKQNPQTRNWTMDPYDRESVSDALRGTWCVVGLTEQEVILKTLQSGGGNPSTTVADCK